MTAVVVGVLMLLFLALIPLVNLVPVVATTGALFFVGITLFPKPKEFLDYKIPEMVSITAMVVATIITFGLDKAMLAGFGLFILFQLIQGKWREINPYLLGSVVLLLVSIFIS